VTSGKLSNICPYFGSRKAIRQAQVCLESVPSRQFSGILAAEPQLVALPYNLLLSSVARKALGIDVTNQIIVIDEAHSAFYMGDVVNPLSDLLKI